MKTLLTILLLLTQCLLWGQDTIRFEPLEFIDTIYSVEELSKNGKLSHNFFLEEQMPDSTLFTIDTGDDILLVKKVNNKWLVYKFDNYRARNIWYKVDNRFYINDDAMGNSGGESESDSCGYWRWSWSYESISILDILDMRVSSYEIYISFNREGGYQYDFESDDYKQKLMSCRNTFETFNAEYQLKNDILSVSVECSGGDYVLDPEKNMTSYSKSHCSEEGYLQAGEYHYINGNFVKVKPNE